MVQRKQELKAERLARGDIAQVVSGSPTGKVDAGEDELRSVMRKLILSGSTPDAVKVQAWRALQGEDRPQGEDVLHPALFRSLSTEQHQALLSASPSTLAEVVGVLVDHALAIHLPPPPHEPMGRGIEA